MRKKVRRKEKRSKNPCVIVLLIIVAQLGRGTNLEVGRSSDDLNIGGVGTHFGAMVLTNSVPVVEAETSIVAAAALAEMLPEEAAAVEAAVEETESQIE